MLTKEQWADRERTCLGGFLDELIICDGYKENEDLALQIIDELRKKFHLLAF